MRLPFCGVLCVVVATAKGAFDLGKDRCTAILVGAKASRSGTPMTTHSNDCADCDFRLIKVPPMSHGPGTMRDVLLFNSQYPRYVGTSRGAGYMKEKLDDGFFNWLDTVPIAQIPQVNETYGYLEGVYGIMNEHQLAMGESTCSAKLASKPVGHGGAAYFDITELGRLALERTKTAREAISLMGHMAESYGYYGGFWDSSDPYGSAGEALTITDPTEAWMFHILPDDSGASAVWVAQRVPDTHITVVANEFVIHEVNLSDKDNFMGSTNMYSVAERNGFWDGQSTFDFAVVFGTKPSWQYSFTRRVWRVLSLANPHLNLSPTTDSFGTTYPFSVEVANPLVPEDLMRFHRDHYENTAFDLTQGPAAGPFGNPDRYGVGDAIRGGHFERAISTYTATYTFVSTLDADDENNGLLWFGPYAPHATIYSPVYAKVKEVPPQVSQGSLRQFNTSGLFWSSAAVGNYAAKWYKFAHPVVSETQNLVESIAMQAQKEVQAKSRAIFDANGEEAVRVYLTKTSEKFASEALEASHQLFNQLMTRFHDGFIMSNFSNQYFSVQAMGYPQWWLDSVGYYNSGSKSDGSCNIAISSTTLAAFCLLVLLCFGTGFHLGRRGNKQRAYAFIQ